MNGSLTKLAREPLLQFLLLGAAVFALDRYVFVTSDQPRRIVVDDARYAELVSIFEEGQGRAPSESEMDELIVTWAQNEVFYREALGMELDRGDEMIRQRLILKYRDVLFGNLLIEPPDDATLRAWFERHRTAYDQPPLVDFEQFLLPQAERADAVELARSLGDSRHPEEFGASFRLYRQRPESNLGNVFGADGQARLLAAPRNEWVAVPSDYGWHLARITRAVAASPAEFESIRHDVASDWLKQAREDAIAAALEAVVADYDIRYRLSRDLVEARLAREDTADLPGS